MKKFIYIILLISFLILGFFLYSNYLYRSDSITDNSILGLNNNTDNLQSLTLEVISTDNIKTIYGVAFKNTQNLIEILNDQANNKADFTFDTEKYSYGELITTINGKKADTNEFWSINVNGNISQVGASDIVPQNNDVITFSLLKF